MSGICSKTALGLKRAPQLIQQLIDSLCHRQDFVWKSAYFHCRQIAWTATGQSFAEPPNRSQTAPDD